MTRSQTASDALRIHYQQVYRWLRRHRILLVVAALLVTGQRTESHLGPGGGDPQAASPAVVTSPPARFTAVTPTRVMDTRVGSGALAAAGTTTLDLSASVPDDATAVTMTVTVTNTAGPGFVTVWPTGQNRPLASSINATNHGQTIANLVTVLLGTGKKVEFYSQTGADIVADLAGWFHASGASRAGRFTPLQSRALDTRVSQGALPSEGTVEIDLKNLPDLYEHTELIADATAVAVNLTMVDAPVGYWSLYPSDRGRPSTSNANVDTKGRVTATMAVVAVADASFKVFTQSGGHLVVDVLGYFTGDTAPEETKGLFVATAPTRLVDTRSGRRPVPNSSVTTNLDAFLAGTGYEPEMISALETNTTITETSGPGYFTVYPGGYPTVPSTSNLNAATAGTTVANHVTTPVTQGGVSIYTQSGGHVVVDITGFYLGEPVECWSCVPTREPRVGGSSDWYAPTPATIGAAWTTEAPVWSAPDAAIFELDAGIMLVALYHGVWRAHLVAGASSYLIEDSEYWNHIFTISCPDGLVALWAIVSTDYDDLNQPYYQEWRPLETEATC